jgi:hypothetical protein
VEESCMKRMSRRVARAGGPVLRNTEVAVLEVSDRRKSM